MISEYDLNIPPSNYKPKKTSELSYNKSLLALKQNVLTRALEKSIIKTHALIKKNSIYLPRVSFMVTFLIFLTRFAFGFYAKDELQISASRLLLISALREIPWALKVILGIISDRYPLLGSSKAIYISIGGLVYGLSYLLMSFLPSGPSSAHMAAFLSLASSVGIAMVDVANDALIVRTTQTHVSSKIQSKAFLYRSAGVLSGQLATVFLLSNSGSGAGSKPSRGFFEGLGPRGLFRLGALFSPILTLLSLRITEAPLKNTKEERDRWRRRQRLEETENATNEEKNDKGEEISESEGPGKAEEAELNRMEDIEERSLSLPVNNLNNENNILNRESSSKIDFFFDDNFKNSTVNVSITQLLQQLTSVLSNPKIFRLVVFILCSCGVPGAGTAIFYYVATPVSSGGLGLSVRFMSILYVAGGAAHLLGNILYTRFLASINIRTVYTVLLSVYLCIYASQILLVLRINVKLHLPDQLFVLGEDILGDALREMMVVPVQMIIAKKCPKGVEGTVYAMIVSIGNISGIFSRILSSMLTNMFHVGEKMANGQLDFRYLPFFILLVVFLQSINFYTIKFLPNEVV